MIHKPTDFPLGAVVANREIPGNMPHEPMLGHVAGFGRNLHGETIIEVRWSDGSTRGSHPANLVTNPAEWPKGWSDEEALRRMRA